jgi:hypothetical protein
MSCLVSFFGSINPGSLHGVQLSQAVYNTFPFLTFVCVVGDTIVGITVDYLLFCSLC